MSTFEKLENSLNFLKSILRGSCESCLVIQGCFKISSIVILCLLGTKIFFIRSLTSAERCFASGTELFEAFTIEGIDHFFNVFHDLSIIFTVKRWSCRGKNIEDYSCRPDITSFIIVEIENFRGNIVGSSKHLILLLCNQLIPHIVFPLIGQSEINYLKFKSFLRIHQEIFRLEITMSYLLRM